MELIIIYVTDKGRETAEKIADRLYYTNIEGSEEEYKASLYDYRKENINTILRRAFELRCGIIFVSAMGICVRAIAPFIKDKTSDPAVVCLDDMGLFCISVLSGHLGGANELCRKTAALIKAQPVITTATDVHNSFSPDVFAKENQLWITDMQLCKKIAAASVAGENIGIYIDGADADYGIKYTALKNNVRVYKNIAEIPDKSCGIVVSQKAEIKPFENTLWLIPQRLVVGVGARKNIAAKQVYDTFCEVLDKYGLDERAVCAVTSIDLKKNEAGIQELADRLKCSFVTYSEQQLTKVAENMEAGMLTESAFVKAVTGVANVCETSALAFGAKKLLVKKYAKGGVTIAVGEI